MDPDPCDFGSSFERLASRVLSFDCQIRPGSRARTYRKDILRHAGNYPSELCPVSRDRGARQSIPEHSSLCFTLAPEPHAAGSGFHCFRIRLRVRRARLSAGRWGNRCLLNLLCGQECDPFGAAGLPGSGRHRPIPRCPCGCQCWPYLHCVRPAHQAVAAFLFEGFGTRLLGPCHRLFVSNRCRQQFRLGQCVPKPVPDRPFSWPR